MKLTDLEMAEECVRIGNLPRAVRAIKRALRKGTDPLVCYTRLAELHRLQHQWTQAISAARQAVNLATDPLPYREMLVDILMESGLTDDAVLESRRWVEENPGNLIALEVLLRAYWQCSNFDEALKVSNQLVKINPYAVDYRLQRAALLQQVGLYIESIQDYEQILEWPLSVDVLMIAHTELATIDRLQLHMIMTLLVENPMFRLNFRHNRHEAVTQRGFRLSLIGKELLETVAVEMLEVSPSPVRYAGPN
jgi:hypothetical protein